MSPKLLILFIKGDVCSVGPAHPVHTSPWGGRSGTEEDILERSAVLPPRGAQEKLTPVGKTTVDVTPNEVSVSGFQIAGPPDPSFENAIAETRGETLDLGFETRQHI